MTAPGWRYPDAVEAIFGNRTGPIEVTFGYRAKRLNPKLALGWHPMHDVILQPLSATLMRAAGIERVKLVRAAGLNRRSVEFTIDEIDPPGGWPAGDSPAPELAHRTKVMRRREAQRVVYRYECTCGTDGAWRADPVHAEEDADSHVKENIGA
jgi:hypothetical protein